MSRRTSSRRLALALFGLAGAPGLAACADEPEPVVREAAPVKVHAHRVQTSTARHFIYGQGTAKAVRRELLSFEVESGRFGCYRPAVSDARWLERFQWMERAGARWWPIFGAVYFLVATKRVRGMRLLGPRRAIGHHWGTFQLTDEPVDEPKKKLAEALAAAQIPPEAFEAAHPGQVFTL